MTVASRESDRHEYIVAVGVQKHYDTEADLDALTLLVEELSDYIRNHRLTGLPTLTWIGTKNNPFIIPEHLQEMQQFTSFLAATYTTCR